ncbi:hypothetical protein DFS34DRAFT_688036 [Phlyctochytrium arcticum]|nr:hypothetical protein DFS34DRAFT_688036 [Phlyctochytrium arcticum]
MREPQPVTSLFEASNSMEDSQRLTPSSAASTAQAHLDDLDASIQALTLGPDTPPRKNDRCDSGTALGAGRETMSPEGSTRSIPVHETRFLGATVEEVRDMELKTLLLSAEQILTAATTDPVRDVLLNRIWEMDISAAMELCQHDDDSDDQEDGNLTVPKLSSVIFLATTQTCLQSSPLESIGPLFSLLAVLDTIPKPGALSAWITDHPEVIGVDTKGVLDLAAPVDTTLPCRAAERLMAVGTVAYSLGRAMTCAGNAAHGLHMAVVGIRIIKRVRNLRGGFRDFGLGERIYRRILRWVARRGLHAEERGVSIAVEMAKSLVALHDEAWARVVQRMADLENSFSSERAYKNEIPIDPKGHLSAQLLLACSYKANQDYTSAHKAYSRVLELASISWPSFSSSSSSSQLLSPARMRSVYTNLTLCGRLATDVPAGTLLTYARQAVQGLSETEEKSSLATHLNMTTGCLCYATALELGGGLVAASSPPVAIGDFGILQRRQSQQSLDRRSSQGSNPPTQSIRELLEEAAGYLQTAMQLAATVGGQDDKKSDDSSRRRLSTRRSNPIPLDSDSETDPDSVKNADNAFPPIPPLTTRIAALQLALVQFDRRQEDSCQTLLSDWRLTSGTLASLDSERRRHRAQLSLKAAQSESATSSPSSSPQTSPALSTRPSLSSLRSFFGGSTPVTPPASTPNTPPEYADSVLLSRIPAAPAHIRPFAHWIVCSDAVLQRILPEAPREDDTNGLSFSAHTNLPTRSPLESYSPSHQPLSTPSPSSSPTLPSAFASFTSFPRRMLLSKRSHLTLRVQCTYCNLSSASDPLRCELCARQGVSVWYCTDECMQAHALAHREVCRQYVTGPGMTEVVGDVVAGGVAAVGAVGAEVFRNVDEAIEKAVFSYGRL